MAGPAPSAQPEARSILVVDDDPVFAGVVEDILKAEGYRVSTATSGLTALERVGAAPFAPIHEDAAILVVDKPAGLLTIATARERERTAYRLLMDYVAGGRPPGRERVFIVHRLDRETSGLLVFAKSPVAKRTLQAQFAARTPERVYVAVVEGRVRGA